MSTIFLPLEIGAREATTKTLLACRLATGGMNCVIHSANLFHKYGWPDSGAIVGKNINTLTDSSDVRRIDGIRSSGIHIFHLEEEGGIFAGRSVKEWEVQLGKRIDLANFGVEDTILTWGEWQKSYFSSQGALADVVRVGAPNFHMLKPKYEKYFSAFDNIWVDVDPGFILVNTRFPVSNPRRSGENHYLTDSPAARINSFGENLRHYCADGKAFLEFVELINFLAEHADVPVVVRPHPAEDSSTYEKIFRDVRSVLVRPFGDAGSWIRRCSCVVHNGCSTAIQSSIAKKPVITYSPNSVKANSVAELPNLIGKLARTQSEVLAAVKNSTWRDQSDIWESSLGDDDPFERIFAALEDKLGGVKSGWSHVAMVRLRRSAYSFWAERSVKRLAVWSGLSSRRADVRNFEGKFDRELVCSTRVIVQLWNKENNVDVKFDCISPYAIRVYT